MAKTRYRAGDYSEAAHLYQEIVKLQPRNVETLKEAMWGMWNMGHYDDAARLAAYIQILSPKDPEARNILAWAPRQKDKKEESALRRDAVAAYQAGHYEESARLYRELAQMEPGNVAILKEFMWALWYTGRYDEAARVAERVHSLRPTEKEASHVLEQAPVQSSRQKIADLENTASHHADEMGEKEQAIALYKQLIELDPQNPMTLRTLVWALAKNGQFEDAKTYAFELMMLRPKDPEN